MRILISCEDSYRIYSDVLESALRGLRPEAEVAACRLGVIGGRVESFDPHLVVSSRPNTVEPGGRAAWYELSPEPSNHPKPASTGGAGGGPTRPSRRCCRSSTKWRRSSEVGASWEAASTQRLLFYSPNCVEQGFSELRLEGGSEVLPGKLT